MKTKNMRKKALLSSVAMLLVAVLALSGATYAWFSANTTANATGLNFKTNKASTLLFAKPESDIIAGTTTPTEEQQNAYYGTAANWVANYALKTQSTPDDNNRTELTPMSANVSGTGYTTFIAVSETETVSGNESLTKVKKIGPASGTPYTESFYVKSATATNLYLASVAAKNTKTLNEACLRIGIQVGSNNSQIFTLAEPESGQVLKYVSAPTSDTTITKDVTFADLYNGNSSAYADTSIAVGNQTISKAGVPSSAEDLATNGYQPLAALAAETKQLVTITIWLEGNDERCVNSITGKYLDGITFSFGVSSYAPTVSP